MSTMGYCTQGQSLFAMNWARTEFEVRSTEIVYDNYYNYDYRFSLQSSDDFLRAFVLAVNELKTCFDVTSLTTSIVDSLPHDHVHG